MTERDFSTKNPVKKIKYKFYLRKYNSRYYKQANLVTKCALFKFKSIKRDFVKMFYVQTS